MAPRGNPRNQKKATAAEKGKRKAPPSPSHGSSSDTEPSPRRSNRQRGPGIRIEEGNAPSSNEDFRNSDEKKEFEERFKGRKLTKNKSVDFQYFRNENFEFPEWLKEYGVETFLTGEEEVYEHLVRLFYYYLRWDESMKRYTSYVQGVFIAFHMIEFAQIMQISFMEEEEEEINLKEKIAYLTGNRNLPPSTFHSRQLKTVEYRVLFNIVYYCLYPRAGGFDKVTMDDVDLLYGIITGTKMCLVDAMIQYMIQQKDRTNGSLPYGMMLTRLFKHFKVNLKKEKPVKFTSYNLISEPTLKRMRLVKKDGHWTDKSQVQQEEEEEIEEEQAEEAPVEAREVPVEAQASVEAQDEPAAPFDETHQQQREEEQNEENFDHFSFADLMGSSPPHHSELPYSSQPSTSPSHTHTTPQPPQTQSSTLAPQPQIPAPQPQIDLSPILSFMENQFSNLNSRISNIENKVENISTELQTMKHDVSIQLSENQTKMDMIESSFANNCPPMLKTFQGIEDELKRQREALLEALHSGTVALKDLRDNSDRMCLHFKLPTLPELLRELEAQIRREYKRMRAHKPPPSPPPPSHKTKPKFVPKNRKPVQPTPPQSPAHLSESGGSNQAPPPKSSKPPPSTSKKPEATEPPKTEIESSDSETTSTPTTPSTDPYVDKVRSESE